MKKYVFVANGDGLDYYVNCSCEDDFPERYGITVFKKEGNIMLINEVQDISLDFEKVHVMAETCIKGGMNIIHLKDCIENLMIEIKDKGEDSIIFLEQ